MLQRYLKLVEKHNNLVPEPTAGGIFKSNERRLYDLHNYGGMVMQPSLNRWSSEPELPAKAIDYKNVNALNREIERMNDDINSYLRKDQQYLRKY